MSDYSVSIWLERDRANVRLDGPEGEVFDLWDEAVHEAIADGFLVAPRGPRAPESAWLEPALDYARSMGLLGEHA